MKGKAKTVVVTGANRGMGLEFCRQFKEQGNNVIALCRKASEDLISLGIQIHENIDVRNPESLQNCVRDLQGIAVDILINNAGFLHVESIDNLDYEMITRQFEINTLGPLRVTEAFLSLMSSGSKIIMLSSILGSLNENLSSSYYGYRLSKCALNMVGKNLAHDLRPKGITVLLLHPGYVQTDMTRHKGDVLPVDAVRSMKKIIEEKGLESSGTYWHSTTESSLPW